MGEAQQSVGLLGGGQLSQMLAKAALKLNLNPIPFCGAADEPAAQVSSNFVVGKMNDGKSLETFFSKVSLTTFENDFLPYQVLREFSKAHFAPPLSSMEKLMDKISQKEILNRLEISTPKFHKFDGGDLKGWIGTTVKEFNGNAVFKWARGGYDGKGVHIFSKQQEPVRAFCEKALKLGVNVFVEEKINFKSELALITSYSTKKEFAFYPLVISQQSQGICKRVLGPATSLGVSAETEQLAQKYAKLIAEDLQLFGTFAIEFFEDDKGQLWVNELAPRVHNTGHFSIEACAASQFENHWRGILGEPLGSTKAMPAFAMINLLGIADSSKSNLGELKTPLGIYFHWYGKKEVRVGRKMGHLTLVCSSLDEFQKKLPLLEQLEQEWLSKFSRPAKEEKK